MRQANISAATPMTHSATMRTFFQGEVNDFDCIVVGFLIYYCIICTEPSVKCSFDFNLDGRCYFVFDFAIDVENCCGFIHDAEDFVHGAWKERERHDHVGDAAVDHCFFECGGLAVGNNKIELQQRSCGSATGSFAVFDEGLFEGSELLLPIDIFETVNQRPDRAF